ncbi:hypothetical protein Ac2012v2_002025 [Leucoagaricus gongylophorus]
MTEVFAGINHRLSEVYGKIELPNQDAKARLLADARFLHKELSGLKNVVAPMGMLETVVSEKQIPRATISSSATVVARVPTRPNTLTANQRLKGLLSRSSTIKPVEKASLSPTQTVISPRTSSSSPPPHTIRSPTGGSIIQHAFASTNALLPFGKTASVSNLTLNEVSTPSIPDCVLSTSPLTADTRSEGPATLLPLQQNDHTFIGSPSIVTAEPSLPEIPSTERTADTEM